MTPTIREGMIVGIGNSMLDLIGHADEEILEKYKLVANHGFLAQDIHLPLFSELLEKYNANYVIGGSVQNTLRVTQWVLEVPKVCIIFGGIGSDEQARQLVAKAQADGVDTQYQSMEDVPTGVCAVVLTKKGAERTLVANLSAAKCFTIGHLLKPENQLRLQNANVIYVSGFFIAVNVDAILHVAQCAYERNAWFVMNLSASYLAEQFMDDWLNILPYVDLLFGNEVEARAFAVEKKFKETTDIKKIALELCILPKMKNLKTRIVVITQGHDPVVVAQDGVVREFPVTRLSPESIVDTTGAGDAFVGGFLAQLVRGSLVEECVSCGIWCATQMVQQQGCSLQGFVKYPSS